MATSIADPRVQQVLDLARSGNGTLFPSPEDWRDVPIYFLMVDRFNNPSRPPAQLPIEAAFGQFQGGSYAGIRAQLPYLRDLGFGAIWLSPVLKNPQYDRSAYHGYGIQDFLAAEPRFASDPARADEELRALVDAAHNLGLYIVFDIVLHHAGDVFAYGPDGTAALGWQPQPVPIQWRDAGGRANPAWGEGPVQAGPDEGVWPAELCHNDCFTRRGNGNAPGGQPAGDFESLKGFRLDPGEGGGRLVDNLLIRAYQYVVARWDVDAFRIDTLKYVPAQFERTFANAIREFALSAGKKNFFTFGEVWDSEATIARFIGRNSTATGEPVGVDAALDYPVQYILPALAKGLGPTPNDLAQTYQTRKVAEADTLTSHGEAGQYFVTFLDNHDQAQRFGYTGEQRLLDQITLGLTCLYGLPGIPCIYYGTEQGLDGHKTALQQDDSLVREALWGRTGDHGEPAFDPDHPLHLALQALGRLRAAQPALRYGRYYFRPISGDGSHFGISGFRTGVLAFSRILNDQELVIAANTDRQQPFRGEIIVDRQLNPDSDGFRILYSNKGSEGRSGGVFERAQGTVAIAEVDGSATDGPIRVLSVLLQPGEVQVLGR